MTGTASEAAVQVAMQVMGCVRERCGSDCTEHWESWTNRGCAKAASLADAICLAATRQNTAPEVPEVERLTRECLDREATETDARERLRQAEERLAKLDGLAQSAIQAEADAVHQLEDTLAAVAALHVKSPDGLRCLGCLFIWPCPTISELR